MRDYVYDTAQICENAHIITESLEKTPELAEKFCGICGAPTISSCPNCNSNIRGYYYDGYYDGEIRHLREPPAYCHECGEPYPWTQRAIEELHKLAQQAPNLTDEERTEFASAAEEVVRQTPGQDRAAYKLKELLQKAGSEFYAVAKEIFTRGATEAALRHMGLE